jgi:flagellar hook assembly protein FlgD
MLAIYEVNGRLVRILDEHTEMSSGTHTYLWDGFDASGEKSGTGTYIIRLRVNNTETVSRVTRID